MSELSKKYIEPIKTFWINLTRKKKIILISVFTGVVAVAILVGVLMNRQPYVVLYPGLDKDEAVEVMNELKDRGVPYQEKDGGTILVPKDQENSLRMDLSNMGHPKTAPNYDFFTQNTDVMTTDYERKVIEKYQLNQRLEAVIKTLDGVEGCNVTISIPDENTYAWDESSAAPTASVTVTMRDGKSLETKQVNGIKQLVSKSVPNMKAEDVAVVDTSTGEEITSSESGSTNQINLSEFKRSIEKAYEKDVENNVMKVLTPLYGAGNVGVTAKSVMDVDKKVQEIITYQPSSSSSNTGVVSESTTIKEQELGGNSSGGAAAGAEANSDVTTYPGVTVNGNVIYTKDEQTYKYLVSQVKEQIQGDAASIKDMTISVVVNQPMMNGNQKTQITSLVANAAAIDPSKVVVYNASFAQPKAAPAAANPFLTPQMTRILLYGGIGLAALLLILAIVLIVRARRRRARMEAEAAAQEDQGVPADFYEMNPIGSTEEQQAPEDLEQAEEEEAPAEEPEEEEEEPEEGEEEPEEAEEPQDEGEPEEEQEEEDPEVLARKAAQEAAEEALRNKREALEALEKSRAAQATKEEVLRGKLKDFAGQNPEIAAQLIRVWLRGDDFDD